MGRKKPKGKGKRVNKKEVAPSSLSHPLSKVPAKRLYWVRFADVVKRNKVLILSLLWFLREITSLIKMIVMIYNP